MNNIKLIISNLIKKIKILDYYYYILNKSIVSDYKYDQIINKLKILEKNNNIKLKNSPTKNIYYSISKNLSKKLHLSNMLSLKNTYLNNKLIKFNKEICKKNNINKIKYCCEIKLDGIAINLIYKNGILFKALTRGNGIYGEDITNNIKYIKKIPTKLLNINNPSNINLIEIRGEVCISKMEFNKINYILKNNNRKIFNNERNAASGIIRNFKENKIYNKILNLFCYGIGEYYCNNKNLFKIENNHFNLLNKIKLWGFDIPNYIRLCSSIEDSIDFCKYINKIRNQIEFKIDGVVIKTNCRTLQNKLKSSSKYPNWAIAFKFSPNKELTTLNDIYYSVGRTGIITPIAILEPLIISNTLIKKSSLYNLNKIKKLDLMIGDKVLIKKSGDIIPVIEKAIINKRNNNVKKIDIPKKCPSCLNEVIIINNILKCNNGFNCKSQIKFKTIHFFSNKSILIKNIDKKLINKLFNKNLISSPIDVFLLDYKKLNYFILDKEKCLETINDLKNKKNIKLFNFIFSLSIEGIGEKNSIILSNNIIKINDLIYIKLSNLKYLNMNSNLIKNIYYFFNNKNNIIFIKRIINYISIINN